MATKKRRLTDLYTSGREVTFNDEEGGDPIVVFIRKLSTLDAETAARRSSSAKARVLIDVRNKESEEYISAYGEMADLPRETLIDIVVADDLGDATQSIDSETSAKDEWAKDDYLQGLQDSWNDELRAVYELGDESNEKYGDAKRVFGELQRFDGIVTKLIEGERNRLRRDAAELSDHELREKSAERNFTLRADMAWVREWRRSQIWLGVRDNDDHNKRYFTHRHEVDELATPMLDRLYDEFDRLNVDVQEGKDLPPTPNSSPLSDQQDAGETAASSGPVVVNP